MSHANKNTISVKSPLHHVAMVAAGLIIAVFCYLALVRDTNTERSVNEKHKTVATSIQTAVRIGSASLRWLRFKGTPAS